MSKKLGLFLGFFLISIFVFSQKPRTIVTTDGEIDDVDSFIRMLLYANEFKLEGLVYSSSMWHYKGDGKGTKMVSEMEMTKKMYGEKTDLRWPGVAWMQDLIEAYKAVYPNLILHDKTFPSPAYLNSIIKVGNIDFEGEMKYDTDGSNFIKAKLLDKNPQAIFLQAWGGTNTIARALLSIEQQYKGTKEWESIYKKVSDKAIIFTIMDQDATYKNYVAKNWPKIRVYYNSGQFACLAYPWKDYIPKAMQHLFEGKFMGDEIINNHGPLTKMYYSYGDGQKQAGDDEHIHGDINKLKNAQWGSFEKYDFISEGDSPAYLHLIDVGLDNLKNPEYGGWGGRLKQSISEPNRWEDGKNVSDFNFYTEKMDNTFPQTRWLDVIQNDFASRADWCINDFKHANHAPIVKILNGKKINGKPNDQITISATAIDPDKDTLSYKWWQYHEVDSYDRKLEMENTDKLNLKFLVPSDLKKGQNIHLILEVKDNGIPNLTRYQRIIIQNNN